LNRNSRFSSIEVISSGYGLRTVSARVSSGTTLRKNAEIPQLAHKL
jgi:hypothetical protein